jgi:hypothetical protein
VRHLKATGRSLHPPASVRNELALLHSSVSVLIASVRAEHDMVRRLSDRDD